LFRGGQGRVRQSGAGDKEDFVRPGGKAPFPAPFE
jgi:hypothetical protein